MIGKKEWNEMAKQILTLEKQMKSVYGKLAEKVENQGLKKVFTQMARDEQDHADKISGIAEKILES